MRIRSAAMGLAALLCLVGGAAPAMPLQVMTAQSGIERAAVVTRVVRRTRIVRRPATIVRRRVIVR